MPHKIFNQARKITLVEVNELNILFFRMLNGFSLGICDLSMKPTEWLSNLMNTERDGILGKLWKKQRTCLIFFSV